MTVLGLGLAPLPVWAYLDPGQAYALLQPLFVAVAAASTAFIAYRDRAMAALRRWTGRPGRAHYPEAGQAEDDQGEESAGRA